MKVVAWLFGGAWITVWTVATIGFDVALVRGVVQEVRAADWPTTPGRVISAEIKVEHDSESGSSYTPQIRYLYTVNGTDYGGDRIRFGFNNAGKSHARQVVEGHQPGSGVVVHYDPNSPGRAVLETGILTGNDLFGVIFLVPFKVVMLASWVVVWRAIRALSGRGGGDGDQRAAGNAVTLVHDSGVLRVRLTKFSPAAAGAAASAVGAIALVFVIALTFGTDSRSASAAGCGLIGAAGVIGYRGMRRRINDGWYDLIIDDVRRKVTLPGKLKRADTGEISFGDVTGVEVEKVAGSGDDSDKYRPTLRWTKEYPQRAVLADLANAESAERLAQWLRDKLGVATGPQKDFTRGDRAVA
jgi:hypothetical protein